MVYERKIVNFFLAITATRECRVHGTYSRNRNRTWRDGAMCAAAAVIPAATRDSIILI